MIICEMNNSDWDSVKEIYQEGIISNKATIVKELPTFQSWNEDHHQKLRFIAKYNEKVVGFIALRDNSDNSIGELSIYVKVGFWRKGFGTNLIRKIQEEYQKYKYKALYSKIFSDNIASIMLHEKMGFTLKGKTPLEGDNRSICTYEWRAS